MNKFYKKLFQDLKENKANKTKKTYIIGCGIYYIQSTHKNFHLSIF